MAICTKGLEEWLKLEKTSPEEYNENNKVESQKETITKNKNSFDVVLLIIIGVLTINIIIIVLGNIKTKKIIIRLSQSI